MKHAKIKLNGRKRTFDARADAGVLKHDGPPCLCGTSEVLPYGWRPMGTSGKGKVTASLRCPACKLERGVLEARPLRGQAALEADLADDLEAASGMGLALGVGELEA